ncbi:TIR domain-containing protein [Corallococcus exercitus]|uniref:TIR domain-containing protein n=1 Tax=Corallococcus exercitus TaxID=2316736 RepID=A0A7Y4NU91_9BACT|nr:TIR domain-containing protein [Corallococcus exercitus]NOK36053.1 TIR domain-containing protein [Corallococcus exercitus]
MAAIFISHSSKDNAWAIRIKQWLSTHGHQSIFLDFDPEAGINAGQDWEQVLYAKLRQCQAVLALVSDDWLASKWCFAEAVQAREKGKQLLIAKISTPQTQLLFGDLQHIDFVSDEAEAFERLRLALTDVFALPAGRPPYPGMVAFDEEEAAVFVGREPEISDTLEVLEGMRMKRSSGERLLLILGASGSGKSSLMRAGVLPRLRRYPDRWLPIRPFKPDMNPTREMAFALAGELERHGTGRSVDSILSGLAPGDRTAAQAGAALASLAEELLLAAGQPTATVILIIDQAEELFSYSKAGHADAFLRLLRAALETSGGKLIAIATLRSDFLGEFQNHGFLSDPTLLPHRDFALDPMPIERFETVIRVPARRAPVPIEFEEALVRKMVSDTGTRDALPLLAFTLQRLWNNPANHEGGVFHVSAYEALGGLTGVVSKAAQEALPLDTLKPDEVLALRNTFVPGLVQVDAAGGRTRRRARLSELPAGAVRLLQPFIEARLLVTGVDEDGEKTVEVAHEALLRTWPVLTRWIDEDQDKLRLLDGLRRAALDWSRAEDTSKEDLLVHRDGRLSYTLALLQEERFARVNTEREETYLKTCEQAQERRVRLRKRLVSGLQVTSVLLLAAAILAGWQWHRAGAERNVANQRAAEALAERNVANRRAAEAFAMEARSRSSNESIAWLQQTQPTFQNVMLGLSAVDNGHSWHLWKSTDWRENGLVRWSPDGRILAYAPYDAAEIHVIDMHDGKPSSIPRARDDLSSNEYLGVRQMAWSPSGTVLAILQGDESILLWRKADGGTQLLSGYEQSGGIVMDALAWSPEGDKLLAADAQGRIRVWEVSRDVAKPSPVADVSDKPFFDEANSLEWSPDASILAVGSTHGTIALWQRSDGVRRELLRARGEVLSLAWSPDGKQLAASTTDGAILIFEGERLTQHREYLLVLSSGASGAREIPARPPGKEDLDAAEQFARDVAKGPGRPLGIATLAASQGRMVAKLAWSPLGGALAAAGNRGQLWLLNVDAGTQRLLGDGAPPLRWSPSGSRLASQGATGVVQVRDLNAVPEMGGRESMAMEMREFRAGTSDLAGLEWALDNRALVTVNASGVVQVWDTAREEGKVIPNLEMDRPCGVAWSRDGGFLAVRSFSGSTVAVWRKSDGAVRRFEGLVDAWRPPVDWSPTAALLVLPMRNGQVLLLDASTGEVSELDRLGEGVHSVRWSRDGTRLLGATQNTLVIWDLPSKQKRVLTSPLHLTSPGPPVADWSPDGKTVVVAQSNGALLFWDSIQKKTWVRRETRTDIVTQIMGLDWISERLLLVRPDSHGLEVWDLVQDVELNHAPSNKPNMYSVRVGNVGTYAWSAERKYMAIGGGLDAMVEMFDESLQRVQQLNGPGGHRASAVAWSPDGAFIAAGTEAPTDPNRQGGSAVHVWEVASGRMMTLVGHHKQVWGIDWSPDGELLASTSDDGSVRLWPFPIHEDSYQRFLTGRSNLVVEDGKVVVRAFDGLPWRR